MPNVNYLGYNPSPPALEVNRYNDPKARNSHNNNFSEILATQKSLLIQKAYGDSTLRGASAPGQSWVGGVMPNEIGARLVETRNDGLGNVPLNGLDENGTNLAIKELAIDMEKQFLTYMWNLAYSSAKSDPNVGSAEEVFQQELVAAIVASDDESDIAKEIYTEAMRMEGIKDDRGIRDSRNNRE